ncbi:MAG TPA: hypothetical protein VK828_18645 [Terriglobales bacterium]|nr:hypothetical protein [Terriglobales bacterium]
MQSKLELSRERVTRNIVVQRLESGRNVVASLQHIGGQIPKEVGKEGIGVTPKENWERNGKATELSQLVKKSGHEGRAAGMPYRHHEDRVPRMFLGGIFR